MVGSRPSAASREAVALTQADTQEPRKRAWQTARHPSHRRRDRGSGQRPEGSERGVWSAELTLNGVNRGFGGFVASQNDPTPILRLLG